GSRERFWCVRSAAKTGVKIGAQNGEKSGASVAAKVEVAERSRRHEREAGSGRSDRAPMSLGASGTSPRVAAAAFRVSMVVSHTSPLTHGAPCPDDSRSRPAVARRRLSLHDRGHRSASDRVHLDDGPPRLAESPVNLECRRYREIELGDSAFVVGELLLAHVDDTLLTDGHVDPVKLRPLGRLGGDGYMPLREVIHLARPKVRREGGGGGA